MDSWNYGCGGVFRSGLFRPRVYRQAPPIPERLLTTDGQQVWTKDDILTGQQVWQSTGGQQLGSIWGHGAYMAPDWSADWLHREALALLEVWAQNEGGVSFASLAPERQLVLRERLRQDLRANTYDPVTGAVTVSSDRREAIARTARHYDDLFGGAPALALLRENYAMQDVTVPDPERRQKLTAFFFWTSWAATTERPNSNVTYTNNWPHEPLVGDILEQLVRPGRDPREDVEAPLLRSDVLSMKDLKQGMVLKGTVRNVVDFGAFIDIGVKQDGLLHSSKIPRGTSLGVGDILDVEILSVDSERGRIGLGWLG